MTSTDIAPLPALPDDSLDAIAVSVPFWVTACVRLLPPRRRNGAEITPSLANAVFPAVQALLSDRLAADSTASTPLDRSRITRRCGLGAKKAGWLFDYLALIGFLNVHRHYDTGCSGRSPDTFTACSTPPHNYVGPRNDVELDHALENAAQGCPPALFADEDEGQLAGTFIYVISSHGAARFKIGVTRDVDGRFRQLQNSSPTALDLLWWARGSSALEKQLHAHFAPYRAHGEWFDFGTQGDPLARIKLVALRLGVVEVSA